MADERPVTMSTGLPETVLDPEPPDAVAALEEALAAPEGERRERLASVAGRWPGFLEAWARLGEVARDDVEAYAFYRVGYHRGLDRLRASGWRGSGFVRWRSPENRGFLLALDGLGRIAGRLGETAEEQRCHQFLGQLAPDFPAKSGGGGP
jgi:hypothetical protein